MDDVKRMLWDLLHEFEATGAWMGHAYGFENMQDYYEKVKSISEQNNLNSSELTRSYADVFKEFESVCEDPNKSFLNSADTEKLEKLDLVFLDELSRAAQKLVEFFHIEDKYLNFGWALE